VWLAATLAVPVVAWRALLPRMRAGTISSLRGFALYALAALSPTMLYLGFFFAMVGLEELTGAALISEGTGRILLFVLAFGLFVWLCAVLSFAIAARRANRPGQ
jgi:hypothetical protein